MSHAKQETKFKGSFRKREKLKGLLKMWIYLSNIIFDNSDRYHEYFLEIYQVHKKEKNV